jgi:glc operon protein GlcG
MRFITGAIFAVAVVAGPALADDQKPNPLDVVPDKMPFDIPYGPAITIDRAMAVLDAAVAEAKKHDWKQDVAVVDPEGYLVAFERMDGAQIASVAIAEHKARTAAQFRRDTKIFETNVQNGTIYQLSLDGVIASRGGIPLVEDGKLIGAIGVSGATGSQDEVVAKVGAAVVNK